MTMDEELMDIFLINSAMACIVKNADGTVDEQRTVQKIKELLEEISNEYGNEI